MEISLLGEIKVSADGIPLPLGGPRQRAVLADLALHAGQAVPAVQLIDDLWGERPPVSARPTLESYISRLRHVLDAAGADGASLETTPAGYMLDVVPEQVDTWQFRDLTASGSGALERGDAATAVTLVTSALALWRGPALADVREAPFAALAAQRLEDERLTVLEKLVEARLRLGQHRELVPEIETLAPDPHIARASTHSSCWRSTARDGRPRRWPPSAGHANY